MASKALNIPGLDRATALATVRACCPRR